MISISVYKPIRGFKCPQNVIDVWSLILFHKNNVNTNKNQSVTLCQYLETVIAIKNYEKLKYLKGRKNPLKKKKRVRDKYRDKTELNQE